MEVSKESKGEAPIQSVDTKSAGSWSIFVLNHHDFDISRRMSQ